MMEERDIERSSGVNRASVEVELAYSHIRVGPLKYRRKRTSSSRNPA